MLCWSSIVPIFVVNTRSLSCHNSPALSRSATWAALRSRSALRASSGSFSVRLDRAVLVSPPARSDRQIATVPASRST